MICFFCEKTVREAGGALGDPREGTWIKLEVSEPVSGNALDAALGKTGRNQTGREWEEVYSRRREQQMPRS